MLISVHYVKKPISSQSYQQAPSIPVWSLHYSTCHNNYISWVYSDTSITVHCVITGKKEVVTEYDIDWKYICIQMLGGIEELHSIYKILHNDIKSDNIVLAPSSLGNTVNAVIVDFGKACDLKQGKRSHLSPQERKQYKVNR